MSHDRRGSGQYQDRNRGPRGNYDEHDHRGGYDRRQDRQQQPQYQRSYVGKKRGRDDRAQEDPEKGLIPRLIKLCDPAPAGGKDGESSFDLAAVEDAVKLVKRGLQHKNHTTAQTAELLLDCCTQLSTKTQVYALLIGLLSVEEPELGPSVLSTLSAQLSTDLASHSPQDHDHARLLLRTLGCLAAVNVAQPANVVGVLEQLVSTALNTAKSGTDPSGHTWQPWTDWLVYAAAAVLPWAGAELAAACPDELARVCDAVTEYLAARPIQTDMDLRPFLRAMNENDEAARSDSGGASFLPWVWSGLSAIRSEPSPATWRVDTLPSLVLQAKGALDGRLPQDAAAQELPAVTVPAHPPQPPTDGHSMDAEPSYAVRAVYVRQCYLPRGRLCLLTEPTEGRAAAERFVCEELMIDSLMAFDGERMAGIKVLTTGLPVKKPYTPILAEVIFGQMLTLPRPRLSVMSYATVMVELCKFPKFEFPKALSGCIRECFLRLECIDPELPPRLVEFLAYHLSNFDYQWPWPRWEWCVDEPETNPQRQFCHDLVSRLIRLSYYDRIHKVLPPKFQALLGSRPDPPALPGEAPTAQPPNTQPSNGNPQTDNKPHDTTHHADPPAPDAMEGVQDAAETAATAADNGENGSSHAAAMDTGDAAAPPAQPSALDVFAGQALTRMRSKASCEVLMEWLREQRVEETLGQGPLGPLQVVMRAVLAAGSKSPSHLHATMERYGPLLATLTDACPDRTAAQITLLQQAADFYSVLPQKVLMSFDRLMALRLATPAAVAEWATSLALPAALRAGNGVAVSSACEVLQYALDRCLAVSNETLEKRSKVSDEERTMRAKAEELQAQARATWASLRTYMREVRGRNAAAAGAGAPGEGSMAEDGAPSDAEARAGAEVEAWTHEELETNARGDIRGRQEVARARDAEQRAAGLIAQANNLTKSAEGLTQAAEAAAGEPDEVLSVVYRNMCGLISQELTAASQVKMETEDGGEGQGSGADAALRVQRAVAYLRSFARRYAYRTAALLPRLTQDTLSHAPDVVKQSLHEVIYADM